MSLRIELAHPASSEDTEALARLLSKVAPESICRLIVVGKTDGPATLEDTSRHRAQSSTDEAILRAGGRPLLDRSWRIFSTGCEGIASPVTLSLAETAADGDDGSEYGLVVGAARSEPLADQDRCGIANIVSAADCVRAAMASAAIEPGQAKLILVKSPVRLAADGFGARHAGRTGSARGAAALGAAVALGEVSPGQLGDDPVGVTDLYATRTMTFSGTETDCVEAIVFGMRAGGDPRSAMTGTVLKDMLDADALRALQPPPGHRPVLLLFKAGIARDGLLRGRRTTIFNGDMPADKHLRAAASGLVGAVFGPADTFISGGSEHQGPDGSCFCVLLSERTGPAS